MTNRTHRRVKLAAGLALAASVTACAAPTTRTLTVSAAASLTDAFSEIAAAYNTAHPDQTVELNLAASGVLAQQIRQGAAVDVFASASNVIMDDLEADGFLAEGTRQDMASNRIVLVTPLDGPPLSRPDDLVTVSRLAIGNPELVPAGMYAQESLVSLGLWAEMEDQVIYGENVRQVLTWVETGEVPAGIVFATDARISQRVRVVADFPPETHDPIRYPIAVVRASHLPDEAAAFVAFVTGPEGQRILARYGFASPADEGNS